MELRGIDKYARYTSRLWIIIVLALVAGSFLNFFDYFIIGFINTFISKPWHLTVGDATYLLLASAIGLVFGGFVSGKLMDSYGRKINLIITVLIYSFFSILAGTVPKGDWQLLAFYRFLIGFGVGGSFAIVFPYVAEFAPPDKRGLLVGLVVVGTPVGTLLSSLSSAYLEPIIGFRGLLYEGGIPLILIPIMIFFMYESPRWLIMKGRVEDAKKVVAKVYKTDPSKIEIDVKDFASFNKKVKWRELFKYPKQLGTTWIFNFTLQSVSYNFTIWGPALLVFVLGISAHQASYLFIFVSLSGLAGRVIFDALLDKIGRKSAGIFTSIGAVIFLLLGGVFHSYLIGSVSLFYILALVGYFFLDANWPVLTVVGSEAWPQNVRGSGWGSGYGFGALGKVLGTIVIGLLIGVGLTISPKPSLAGVLPVFVFFGVMMFISFVVFLLIAPEEKGKSLETIDREQVKI
ncbi:MAG: MFS transporter [Thermoplasmatales archaeon]